MSEPYDEIRGSGEKEGFKKSDVFKGTVIFGAVAGAYMLSLWSICFLLSPTKFIVDRVPWAFVKQAYAKGSYKAQNAKFLQRIPEAYRGRLTISLGEMLTLKVILGPIGIPLKIWITMKIMQTMN